MKKVLFLLALLIATSSFGYVIKETKTNTPIEFYLNSSGNIVKTANLPYYGGLIIGSSATASNNVRLHRSGSGTLQFVLGSDTTAEGTPSSNLATLGFGSVTLGTPLAVTSGGTGLSSISSGNMLWATSTNVIASAPRANLTGWDAVVCSGGIASGCTHTTLVNALNDAGITTGSKILVKGDVVDTISSTLTISKNVYIEYAIGGTIVYNGTDTAAVLNFTATAKIKGLRLEINNASGTVTSGIKISQNSADIQDVDVVQTGAGTTTNILELASSLTACNINIRASKTSGTVTNGILLNNYANGNTINLISYSNLALTTTVVGGNYPNNITVSSGTLDSIMKSSKFIFGTTPTPANALMLRRAGIGIAQLVTGASTTADGYVDSTTSADAHLMVPAILPVADSTNSFQIHNAGGTDSVLTADTTNGRIFAGTQTLSTTTATSLSDRIIAKGNDAYINIASSEAGTYGSALKLVEANSGTGALTNSWNLIRLTSASNSKLYLGWGTSTDPTTMSLNPMTWQTNGYVGINKASPISYLNINGNWETGTITPYITLSTPNMFVDSGSSIDFRVSNNEAADYLARIAGIRNALNNGASDLLFITQAGDGVLKERMRVGYDGKVGFGTSAPQYNLHVVGTASDPYIVNEATGNLFARFMAKNSSGDQITMTQIDRARTGTKFGIWQSGGSFIEASPYTVSGGGFGIGTTNSSTMTLGTNSAAAITIDTAQKVGIGTTTPATPLHVNASASGGSTLVDITDTTTGGAAGVGGILTFGGNDGSTAGRDFVKLLGAKENSTVGNVDSYFSINTRTNVSGFAERVRVSSLGYVGIGVTNPSSALHVKGSSSVATIGSTNLLVADGTTWTSGWTLTTGWSTSGNIATHTASNIGVLNGTTASLTGGEVYQINFTIAGTIGSGVAVSLGTTYGSDSGQKFTSTGAKVAYVRNWNATGATTVSFTPLGTGDFAGTIDEVSIYQVLSSTPDTVIEASNGTSASMAFRVGGSGQGNLFIGASSAGSKILSTTAANTGVGYAALANVATGQYNSAFGQNSQVKNVNGVGNSSFGYASGYNLSQGGYNVYVGYGSGYYNQAQNENTCLGFNACYGQTYGDGGFANVGIGTQALASITSGSNNVAIGRQAGYQNTTALTTGSNNTLLGINAGVTSGSAQYRTVIGASASGTVDNSVTLGRSSDTVIIPGQLSITGAATERLRIDENGKVGIGIISPNTNLHLHNPSAANTYIQITNTTTGNSSTNGMYIGYDNGNTKWNFPYTYGTAPIIIGLNDTEKARWTTAGFGIGTPTPMSTALVTIDNDVNTSLELRNGVAGSGTANRQIEFGYSGADNYRHAIQSVHAAGGNAGNNLNFYIWQTSDGSANQATKLAVSMGGYTYDQNALINTGTGGSGNAFGWGWNNSTWLNTIGSDPTNGPGYINFLAYQSVTGGNKYKRSSSSVGPAQIRQVSTGDLQIRTGTVGTAGVDMVDNTDWFVRLAIASSTGFIGMGTDTPTNAKLHLVGSGSYDASIRMQASGTSGGDYWIGSTDSTWTVGSNLFVFGTGLPQSSNVKMILNSSGNLGISQVPSTATKLDVSSLTNGSSLLLRNGDTQSLTNGYRQIDFGYSGTNQWAHNIKTIHNSGDNNYNKIMFYTWQTSDGASNPGSKLNLTMGNGQVNVPEVLVATYGGYRYVVKAVGGTHSTLAAAVAVATSGDKILVAETSTLSADLTIPDNIEIDFRAGTQLTASGAYSITFGSNVITKNIKIEYNTNTVPTSAIIFDGDNSYHDNITVYNSGASTITNAFVINTDHKGIFANGLVWGTFTNSLTDYAGNGTNDVNLRVR